jgi:putative membrane protein
MKKLLTLTLIGTLLATGSPALLAAEKPEKADKPAEKAAPSAVAEKDQKFVTEAAQGGLFEVAIGKMASEKGSTPHVKQMGAMLVKDHEKANAELKKIATSKGIAVPAELDRKHAGMQQKLATADATKFDEEFLSISKKAHDADIKKFQAASKELTDPELRAFATKTLPVLEKHRSHVEGGAGANHDAGAKKKGEDASAKKPNADKKSDEGATAKK